jgi:protein SCO1/2
MIPLRHLLRTAILAALATATPVRAQWGHGLPPVVDEAATMADRLGQQAALEVSFVDETGRPLVLAEQIRGDLPVVLNFGYFNCPGMCGFVLNQLLTNLPDSGLVPGRDFQLFTISVHHDEGPELAAQKKATYADALENPAWTADWRFLTGAEDAIRSLSDSVGWRFRFDELAKDIDHPPTFVLLSPKGTVVRYLDARQLTPKTLRRAVVEAGEGRVGGFLEQLLVTCYTYDPTTGSYTVTAMTVMRLGGVLTVLAISAMIFILWRRERHKTLLATT